MEETILVFGTTYNQVPLIKKVREAGFNVWATSVGDSSSCKMYADRILDIDTSDKEQLLRVVKTHKIKGLITCGTSTAICTIAYINEQLGLSDKVIPYNVSLNATLKDNFRRILKGSQVVPPGEVVSTAEELFEKSRSYEFPIVLKPIDSGGDKGVEILVSNSHRGLQDAFSRSISYTRAGRLVMEQYVKGITFGVESITINGSTHALAVAEKTIAGFPNCVTTGVFFPSARLDPHLEAILKINRLVTTQLGIQWGPTHIDMVAGEDGRPYVIDIGPRLAGGPIASSLIEASTGYDLYHAAIDLCTGKNVTVPPRLSRQGATVYGSHFIVRDLHGTISSITFDKELIRDQAIHDFRLLKKRGDRVNGVTNDADRLAVFHCSASSQAALEEKIEKMEDGFHVEVA